MKVTITKSEVDKSGQNLLNTSQIKVIMGATPKEHIYSRPAKGGGEWKYVTGVYVKKVLNVAFGFNWDFEIVEHKFDLQIKQAYVLGRLKVRVGEGASEKEIVKMQFGRSEIKFKTVWNPETKKKEATDEPLDIGNDLKAAATDALKKCAAELGIAGDIYGANEFKEVNVIEDNDEEKLAAIKTMLKKVQLSEEDRMYVERIIDEQDTKSYNKVIRQLNNFLKQQK